MVICWSLGLGHCNEVIAVWSFPPPPSGNHLTPLVTTSPAGTAQPIAGVVGAGPNTQVLFGDRNYDGEMRSGFRTNAVYWLDECQKCGLWGDFFFLGRAQSSFAGGASSDAGAPVIARVGDSTVTLGRTTAAPHCGQSTCWPARWSSAVLVILQVGH